ncbi:nuclear transport factor 2 family protein [Flavobacterium agricola]|uniref:Nuclear transport factor 2 family protein n=1 Tax=Flavobacterium agricola TaxID=2870839 RepID=A0ABY6M2W2_9FLAO|nr:nuclear transport factor 2 family protein [Flavobacterium agricola]UYW02019.1 nuclear transport factor 2 family protein [Flavobacterium agricola]
MNVTDIVLNFYKTDALTNHHAIVALLHDDLEVTWYSTEGYLHFNKEELIDYTIKLEKAYSKSRYDITHVLHDKNQVALRYTHYVSPIDNPEQELILAHFMGIWEIKDQKLYKAYVMSQR